MRAAFTEAAIARPCELVESFYLFAGRTVHVRVLGRELAETIDRPFSHLRIDQPVSQPQLTIELWDAHSGRSGSGEEPLNGDGGWYENTVMSNQERFIGQQLPHTFSCLDRKSARIVGSIAWRNRLFVYERAKPLARLLLQWHNDVGVQVIHAALIARANSGLLLAGKSGSGKSTSSLACMIAGFDFLSEDFVGLQLCGDGASFGHSLYNSVFLKSDHLARFTNLNPYAVRGRLPHEEKSAIILSQVFPDRLVRVAQIRALLLPRVIPIRHTQLRPASKGEALLALGPSSLLQIPNRGLGVRGFDTMAQLVERTPCFHLAVGSNVASIPRVVDELLATLPSS
jgi:hypothetical protein